MPATPADREVKRWRLGRLLLALLGCTLCVLPGWAADTDIRTQFRVKYVAEGTVYLDGGRSAGLAEGMKLTIRRAQAMATATGHGEAEGTFIVAQLEVVSVAEASAVCNVNSSNREIMPGDVAYLASAEVQALLEQRAMTGTRKYPQVISFTEGDPLDQEVRDQLPRPPSPEVNRARGRIGFEYRGTSSRDPNGLSSSNLGLVVRLDVSRIAGTYWHLSGYWRGRLDSSSSGSTQESIQDLINRTYHLSLTYENPESHWVAGIGRLNLPWASSLDTIDGGYFGHRFGKATTLGLFAGSTPDPTSWSYNPNRRIAGSFVNFEGGSFDSFRYTSTTGLALSTIGWRADRPFVFFENGFFFKRYLSIYHSLQADQPRGAQPGTSSPGAGISRSFLTFRVQPHRRVAFDFSHTYFRDIPTFDPRLIGTGLLDKYLFQGLSGGVRLELPQHITVYTNLGRSSTSRDPKSSWNQLYGITFGQIWRTGLRADLRYSKFDSAFGRGNYRSFSLSRSFRDTLRWEVMAGDQTFVSPLTNDTGSRFVTTTFDVFLGTHYFIEGGYTLQRGQLQNFDQWFTTLGYRFDSRGTP